MWLANLLTPCQAEQGYPPEALEPLDVAELIPPLPAAALPPYNGYGTLDDSKQNCVALVPKPPKKVRRHCMCGQMLSSCHAHMQTSLMGFSLWSMMAVCNRVPSKS